ncbi:hypothetical protein B0F90DRAFT_1720978 [Multifurca ochricompacta]|uniref:Uncharacterized protein n=1 Tax=Multifurca ochricompacta TaxID=376703 RepID=A0AAD4M412_9AGAM|nr:hypothetical protein B0F90DRAFT_1720978 [Multifurca ochricompacta]
MSALIKSNRSPTFNKENGSDVISSIHGDDREHIHPIDPKVLRRATLKIDFYLIPIVAMYYLLSFLVSPRQSLIVELYNNNLRCL